MLTIEIVEWTRSDVRIQFDCDRPLSAGVRARGKRERTSIEGEEGTNGSSELQDKRREDAVEVPYRSYTVCDTGARRQHTSAAVKLRHRNSDDRRQKFAARWRVYSGRRQHPVEANDDEYTPVVSGLRVRCTDLARRFFPRPDLYRIARGGAPDKRSRVGAGRRNDQAADEEEERSKRGRKSTQECAIASKPTWDLPSLRRTRSNEQKLLAKVLKRVSRRNTDVRETGIKLTKDL
jgi:hypothetical protein